MHSDEMEMLKGINIQVANPDSDEVRAMAQEIVRSILLACRHRLIHTAGPYSADTPVTRSMVVAALNRHAVGVGAFIDSICWMEANDVCGKLPKTTLHLAFDIGKMIADEVKASADFANTDSPHSYHNTH